MTEKFEHNIPLYDEECSILITGNLEIALAKKQITEKQIITVLDFAIEEGNITSLEKLEILKKLWIHTVSKVGEVVSEK